MARDEFGMPLPEITVAEKLALGKLVGKYVNGADWLEAKDEEEAKMFRLLASRHLAETRLMTAAPAWKMTAAPAWKLTGTGLRAFYQGRVIQTEKRKNGRGKLVREIEPAKPGGRRDGE
jgi:hypothetical protein